MDSLKESKAVKVSKPNFSDDERLGLCAQVASRRRLLSEGRLSQGITRQQINQAWKEVAAIVNNVSLY